MEELSKGGRADAATSFSRMIRRCASFNEMLSLFGSGTEARIFSRACSSSSTGWLMSLPHCAKSDLTNSVCRREHEHLLKRGDTVAHAIERNHAQRSHSLADGDFAQFAGVRSRN